MATQAAFTSDSLGGVDDQVTLKLGYATDNTIAIAENYEVRLGVFEQPSSFSLRVGDGDQAREILKKYPKGSPFQLLIGGQPQFSGYTDGFSGDDGSGATEITFEGRDILAPLCDDEIDKEESFEGHTHLELAQKAIARLKLLKPFEADPPSVLSSNTSNRRRLTGANVVALEDDSEKQLLELAGSQGDEYPIVRTKLAERMIRLLQRHFDSVGLFMWADAFGDIVVGAPNTKQPPLWRIERRRGATPTSSVRRAHHRDSYKERYSEVVIFGKSTGHKYARTTVSGGFVDQELVKAGIIKKRVLRDVNVTSVAHAQHLAKKELASFRRKAWKLEYTVSGHSAPCLLTGGQTRAVWAPDTMVDVFDDEYGLSGSYWIEQVIHRRNPKTTTTLTLLPPEILVFGDHAYGSSTSIQERVATLEQNQ